MPVDISDLDVVELEALIARAVQRRAQLQPEVPREPPKHTYGESGLAWRTFLDGEMTVLQFRHPGWGWLTFGLPPNDRAHLLGLLLNQALFKPLPSTAAPSDAELPVQATPNAANPKQDAEKGS
jgi:hypothetical protein